MKKVSILAILLLVSFNANAALLDGETVSYQYYYPNQTSPYSNAANGNYLVGAGVEVSNIADGRGTLDISDTNLYIDYANQSSWNSSAFNGFKIKDVFNSIADFTSISINAVTNMVGFDLSRITVLADEIWVNWEGLSFNSNTIVSLDINSAPNAVPVPAALFMFAPALLGFLGLRRKAKA
jgi:hypothetical protein